MSLKHEYSELSQDEEKLSFTSSQVLEESSERAWRRFTVGASKLSIYLLALLGVLSIGNILLTFVWHNRPAPEILTPEQHPQLFSYPQVATTFSLRPELKEGFIQLPLRRSCRCGATISEALSNNCRYDSHATAWLPPHCLDEELLAEWEQAGPGPNGTWEYYADADGTQPLSVEEVAMLPKTDGFFWMTQEWHVMHCAFSWRKLLRAPVTGITIDRRTDGMHHIRHCEETFRLRDDLQALVTVAGVALDADQGEDKNLPRLKRREEKS